MTGIICKVCGIEKDPSEYTKSSPTRCRQCISIRNKKYHAENKEWLNSKKREYMKKYRVSHPNYQKEYHSKMMETSEEYRQRIRNKRKEYIHNNYTSIYKMNRKRCVLMGYDAVHLRATKLIKKLGIRPNKCPICGHSSDIVAHHPDYSKWNEVVFCCRRCHSLIHNSTIECPKPIDILSYKK